jgi:hypothetical protein
MVVINPISRDPAQFVENVCSGKVVLAGIIEIPYLSNEPQAPPSATQSKFLYMVYLQNWKFILSAEKCQSVVWWWQQLDRS